MAYFRDLVDDLKFKEAKELLDKENPKEQQRELETAFLYYVAHFQNKRNLEIAHQLVQWMSEEQRSKIASAMIFQPNAHRGFPGNRFGVLYLLAWQDHSPQAKKAAEEADQAGHFYSNTMKLLLQSLSPLQLTQILKDTRYAKQIKELYERLHISTEPKQSSELKTSSEAKEKFNIKEMVGPKLTLAISKGNLDQIKEILNDNKDYIPQISEFEVTRGKSIFDSLIELKREDILKLFIDAGAINSAAKAKSILTKVYENDKNLLKKLIEETALGKVAGENILGFFVHMLDERDLDTAKYLLKQYPKELKEQMSSSETRISSYIYKVLAYYDSNLLESLIATEALGKMKEETALELFLYTLEIKNFDMARQLLKKYSKELKDRISASDTKIVSSLYQSIFYADSAYCYELISTLVHLGIPIPKNMLSNVNYFNIALDLGKDDITKLFIESEHLNKNHMHANYDIGISENSNAQAKSLEQFLLAAIRKRNSNAVKELLELKTMKRILPFIAANALRNASELKDPTIFELIIQAIPQDQRRAALLHCLPDRYKDYSTHDTLIYLLIHDQYNPNLYTQYLRLLKEAIPEASERASIFYRSIARAITLRSRHEQVSRNIGYGLNPAFQAFGLDKLHITETEGDIITQLTEQFQKYYPKALATEMQHEEYDFVPTMEKFIEKLHYHFMFPSIPKTAAEQEALDSKRERESKEGRASQDVKESKEVREPKEVKGSEEYIVSRQKPQLGSSMTSTTTATTVSSTAQSKTQDSSEAKTQKESSGTTSEADEETTQSKPRKKPGDI